MDKDFCSEIRANYSGMYRMALSMLKNSHDAEDAVCEAIVTAYEHIDFLRDRTKFKPWLFRILINTCHSVLKGRKKIVYLEQYPDVAEEAAPDYGLFEIVMKLDVRFRQVILLYYYEQLSIKEISGVLKQPAGTVKSQLSRARNALRKELEINE